MIRFLIELLVCRTWFRQFDKLYFVLNWFVMRCKLRPTLAADAQQTAWSKMQAKVKSIYLIIPHRLIQLTTISCWVPETRLRLPQVNKFHPKRVKNLATLSSIFISYSSTGELCSQPIRGNVHCTGWMFPEHVERSFLDPEYSFVAVQRILPTRFAKKSAPS